MGTAARERPVLLRVPTRTAAATSYSLTSPDLSHDPFEHGDGRLRPNRVHEADGVLVRGQRIVGSRSQSDVGLHFDEAVETLRRVALVVLRPQDDGQVLARHLPVQRRREHVATPAPRRHVELDDAGVASADRMSRT